MSRRIRQGIIAVCLVCVLVATPGCTVKWWHLQPTFLAGFLLGSSWGQGTTTVITERFCYENGEPVDCGQLPQP